MKCIEFPHFTDSLRLNSIDEYNKYIKSHEWETIFTDDGGILEICKKCEVVMQNPGGTINFRFGCMIIKEA